MIRFKKPVPSKLLVIHEHPALRARVRKHLESSGYTVVEAGNCKEAIAIMHTHCFEGIIVDNDMEDYESASPLSARSITVNSKTPCLVLATSRINRKQVKDFNSALDDYLYKPFRPCVLIKHVHGVLKASGGREHLRLRDSATYALPGAEGVNLKKLKLPPKQMILLQILISNSPRVVSKAYFADALYSHNNQESKTYNALESLVARLRQKLRDENSNVSIKSVRGVGYRASINVIAKSQIQKP